MAYWQTGAPIRCRRRLDGAVAGRGEHPPASGSASTSSSRSLWQDLAGLFGRTKPDCDPATSEAREAWKAMTR